MLSLVAALLFITPILSSSFRPTYLYFVINLLIISLGAEAGLVSVLFSKPQDHHDKKHHASCAAPKPLTATETSPDQATKVSAPPNEKKPKVVEKSASEKIVNGGVKVDMVKKCPSMPSLFFIGNGDAEAGYEADEYEEEEEEVGGLTGQELFTKAETFIGNFYKQLKMQREESWKRIHGLYQKAF